MAKKDKKINFLDLIPERKCQWEKTEDGKIDLVIPRFKNQYMKKFALKLGKSEFFKVHLDSMGSHVWELIDGTITVEQIGKLIENKKEESPDKLYGRLTEFFAILMRNRFIQFKNYK